MSGIESFAPLIHEVSVGGRKVEIGRFRARVFAEVQAAMRPLYPLFQAREEGGEVRLPLLDRLVGESYPAMRRVVHLATGLEEDWLDGQDPTDVLSLFGLVLEANADFSRRRVAPALSDLVGTVARALASPGAPSSPSSDGSASPSPSPST